MAGLSSFVALAVGAGLWVVLTDEPYVAPPPDLRASQELPASAASVLQRLTRAIEQRDPGAAATLAAPDDDQTATLLRALVTNARAIPLREVALRYVDEIGGLDAAGGWSATVDTTWRVARTQGRPSTTDVRFDFVVADGEVVIAGVGGPGARTPVWMSGRLDVRRVGDVVVMAAVQVERYTTLARRAVPVVRRVLPAWDGSLVVEVPRSAHGVDDALEVERGTFRNVAGVTAVPDGSTGGPVAAHVFLNPAQMRRLRPLGAQVVVSHEAVHVATDAHDSDLPTWLLEGFADYVALRDLDLPVSTAAAQVLDQVRVDGPPRRLPDEADFDEQSDYFGAAYEAAWVACSLLVRYTDEDALLALYRRADGSDDVGAVFRQTTGLSLPVFTSRWRAELRRLASRTAGAGG